MRCVLAAPKGWQIRYPAPSFTVLFGADRIRLGCGEGRRGGTDRQTAKRGNTWLLELDGVEASSPKPREWYQRQKSSVTTAPLINITLTLTEGWSANLRGVSDTIQTTFSIKTNAAGKMILSICEFEIKSVLCSNAFVDVAKWKMADTIHHDLLRG